MRLIELAAVNNQQFSITLDNNIYDITIQQMEGVVTINNFVVTSVANVLMAATIARNNISLLTGSRVVPGMPLLPYQYQEAGNFILLVTGSDSYIDPETGESVIIPCGNAYVDYQEFGITQFLYYASNSELEAIRLANSEALLNGA